MIVEQFTSTVRTGLGTVHALIALVYDPDDPLAVRVEFADDSGVIVWRFARSLLVDALALGVSGVGRVVVCRVNDLLWLSVTSADRVASTGLPVDLVAVWLAETDRAVPVGREVVDGDALLAQWSGYPVAPRAVASTGRRRRVAALLARRERRRPRRTRARGRYGEDPVRRPPRGKPGRYVPIAGDDDGSMSC